MSTMRKGVAFARFGGLRLDLPLDEIGGEQAQYLRDVDWDGNTGRLRPRDGFQKLKAAEATGPYKALFPHSAIRLLATKRVSAGEVKIVAVDKEGVEKTTATWPETAATACFARLGTPSASYTYCRANLTTAKVVRFDGTTFTEPTATVDGVAGKEMPKGKFMACWPAGGTRLVVANTGATGGPNGAVSSNSHVWFSEAEGKAEAYESTAYLQLSPGDGEEITGLTVFNGMVFVFKETKFFVVYGISISEQGRPIFNYREESLGEGVRMKRPTVEALAESSDQLVCIGPEGVYFCTSDGIYVTRGGPPAKISQALRPLEEVSPFEGPMAEFLNGASESFRWPATGIVCLGSRLIVRRYEFMFVLDIPTGEWTCWKMPAVSTCIWTGLTGGGAESSQRIPGAISQAEVEAGDVAWTELEKGKVIDSVLAHVNLSEFQKSKRITATELGNAVPAGATIAGISVKVRGNLELPSEIKLVKAGVPVGTNKAPGGEGEEVTFGGPEDLWGEPWTVAQLNAANFGVSFRWDMPEGKVGAFAHVDGFVVTVYYLTAEAASGVRPRLFCSQSKSVFVTTPTAAEEAGTRVAEWQSGFYDLGTQDEKELVGARVFGSGTIDALSYSDFDGAPSGSAGHFAPPTSGSRSDLDDNALTDSGVMFAHKLTLAAGSRIQRLVRYVREGRTPLTRG